MSYVCSQEIKSSMSVPRRIQLETYSNGLSLSSASSSDKSESTDVVTCEYLDIIAQYFGGISQGKRKLRALRLGM